MRYQVTLQIDESLLEPLIGLMAPYGRISVKLVEGTDGSPPVKRTLPAVPMVQHAKRRVRAFWPEKGMGRVLALRLVGKQSTVSEIKAAYIASGISPNSVGASLSKLKDKGYVKRLDKGVWRLTPKGESALRRLEGVGEPAETAETANATDHE